VSETPASCLNIADEFISRPAREYASKIAVIATEREGGRAEFSYADVEQEVNRVAQALRASNCQPGDRVLIVLPDSVEFIASFFGAAKIGAIAVPVNSMARESDYQHYLRDCAARFAIVHRDSWEAVHTALSRAPVERAVIVGSGQRADRAIEDVAWRWEEWLPERAADLETHRTAPTDPAFFLYTSGTGGPARAAVHGHKDMLVTSRGFAQGVLGVRVEDRTFSVSKLFFAYGLGNGMYFPFSAGATTILYPARPRPEGIADLVRRHKPTVFFSVPTFYGALLREAENGCSMDFSSVRLAVSAGEALPAEIFRRFRERFAIEILDGIGSTEMLHMYISSRPGAARAGSCGVPVPGYQTRILDDHGREVPDGMIGNMWIAGDSMFAEYWNQPALTARVRNGGWFSTGDKFTRDPDGFYHYCGRADDMIKVSGMWVSPGEVENALLTHPAVTECAVVGRPDGMGLVRPVAYVVLRSAIAAPGGGLDSELSDWLHTRLEGFKCPQEYRFVAELPKTATGKIQRFLLRQP
jgi:benzoate-CoA ligase family protein